MKERRKHWYEIRAWADGWEIEQQYPKSSWLKVDTPCFFESEEFRVVPDSEGWLPWYGGECPIGNDVKVDVKLKSGNYWWNLTGDSFFWDGDKDSIIAYRIIKKADPYAELKEAAKDPTKQIRHLGYNSDGEQAWSDWVSHKDTSIWSWKLPINNYEIAK